MGNPRKTQERPSMSHYEDRKVEDPELLDQQHLGLNNYYRNKANMNSSRASRNRPIGAMDSLNASRQDESQIMWLS